MTGLRETRLIVVFCLAMVVLVWIDVAWLVAKARGDAIEKGYSEAFTAANVFAEQATRTIRLLDSISQLVGHDLAKSPSPSLLKDLVDEHALTMDTLVMLSFIDASGRTEGSNLGRIRIARTCPIASTSVCSSTIWLMASISGSPS